MPNSKKPAKAKKNKSDKTVRVAKPKDVRLDVVFAGPLLYVPAVADGSITEVEVFAPRNGHPIGAVFLPGVIFTDAELNDPKCKRWPVPESFSLLDPHSYLIELTQVSDPTLSPFPVTSIPETNHKIKPGRRLSSEWDLSITVKGQLSGWTSHRLAKVTEGLYHGADAPPLNSILASQHRLTYNGVTGAEFYGAAGEARAYLRSNIAKGGTLIVIGEIPYQSSLLHERKAIEAIAGLAGLDLHLAETAPKPFQTRLMSHVMICGASIIVA
jgi:hypothetical protein